MNRRFKLNTSRCVNTTCVSGMAASTHSSGCENSLRCAKHSTLARMQAPMPAEKKSQEKTQATCDRKTCGLTMCSLSQTSCVPPDLCTACSLQVHLTLHELPVTCLSQDCLCEKHFHQSRTDRASPNEPMRFLHTDEGQNAASTYPMRRVYLCSVRKEELNKLEVAVLGRQIEAVGPTQLLINIK